MTMVSLEEKWQKHKGHLSDTKGIAMVLLWVF